MHIYGTYILGINRHHILGIYIYFLACQFWHARKEPSPPAQKNLFLKPHAALNIHATIFNVPSSLPH